MRLDWDLIRAILIRIEAKESETEKVGPDAFPAHERDFAAHHIRLLIREGFAREDTPVSGIGQDACVAQSLTLSGYELLENMRNPDVWHKLVQIVRVKGLSLSLEVVRCAGAHVIETYF